MTLRIVFAGTPEFAVPCLRAAARLGDIVAVYTQPDRPAGRGRQLTPSPVKVEALARGWRIEQPENFKSIESKKVLRELNADIMIVVAYGLLLPQSVLDIPKTDAGMYMLPYCLDGAARLRFSVPSKRATNKVAFA